jgi:23S rRNA pseudouridine1911/1915/1917 synthase
VQLDILYEDDALIFLNKPAGVVVQQRMYEPDEPFFHELVTRYTSPAYLMQRLDRGTSGVLFFTKMSKINARVTRQFEQHRIRKRYLAICEGVLGEAQTIDAPIARVGAIQFGVRERGKRAVTHINPIRATRDGSFLDIRLETGRTHQIRVHLAAIGYPLAGDWLYGKRDAARPMLHAAELEMTHPLTGQLLRVAAPLPDDFTAELRRRGIASAREDEPTPRESS